MASHIPGIELCRNFYFDVVRNLIDRPHAAALLGEGSEVLGYDQARSTDHAWGPRMQIFVPESEVDHVSHVIERGLPSKFKDYPVAFFSWQTQTVRHHVEVTTVDKFLASQIRVNHLSELTPAKWLTIPQQHLLQFTSGAVFHDDIGELGKLRECLSWYPMDVWLWVMASQWHLIGNTQHLVGRTLEASDERGSSMVSFRLVRLMMELAFLQEKRYWPYMKWFGTAFSRLKTAKILGPVLDTILHAKDLKVRESEINRALHILANRHNALQITPSISAKVNDFNVGINQAVRPYLVFNAGDFAEACKSTIHDERLYSLPFIGSIDQLTHSDDLLINFTVWPQRLQELYEQSMREMK